MKLYRPIGLTEMELIAKTDFTKFPPRLEWQPIFYPVLNQQYAEEIALQWNTKDGFSGYCGIVTMFEVKEEIIEKYEIQNVGGEIHNELWIPSNELSSFNDNIISKIEIVSAFFGNEYKDSKIEKLNKILEKFKNEK